MARPTRTYFLCAALLLAGCSSPAPEASSEASSTLPSVSSLKEAMRYMDQNKNYAFGFRDSTGSATLCFTEKYVGFAYDRKATSLSAYVQDEQGIYRLSFIDGYIGGEYILDAEGDRYRNLWEQDLQANLLHKGTDFIESIADDATEITITNKSYRLAFMQAVGYSKTDYMKLNYLKASYDDGLTFSIDVQGVGAGTYRLKDLGTAKIDAVDSYIRSGKGALVVDGDAALLREKMKCNNFTREIYSFDVEGMIGYEYFLPRYFYTVTNGYSMSSGAMSINNENIGKVGVFQFTVVGDEFGFLSVPMYEKPDVTEYYHYPIFMKLWSNMEYLKEGKPSYSGYYYAGKAFHIDDDALVLDFVRNFSIDQQFDISTYVPKALGFDIVKGKSDEDLQITFVYYFTNGVGGEVIPMPIPFSSFGQSNIAFLDAIVRQVDSMTEVPS